MWEKKDLDSTKSTLTSGIIMCWERIDKREGSEQGTVYWDQKWYEHTVQRVSTESRKYTEGNVHRQNEKQYMMAMLCHSYTLDCSTRHWRFCLICFLPQGSSQHFNIYIINLNWSGHSGVFWLLAHLPSQLLLHVVEVLAVFVPQAQQFNHVLCWIEGEVRLHHFKNPTKFSSDHLLFHTDKSVPQLIKCWPLIFFSLLPTNILSPLVVFHSYNQWNNQNRNVIINPTLTT